MFAMLSTLWSYPWPWFRPNHQLALEVLALRHQLAVLQRQTPGPKLRSWDRWGWVMLNSTFDARPIFFDGMGANAFFYQQTTGDRGRGAVLGEFEGQTVGVGPVLSFSTKVGGKDLVAELKWLPELDVEKRVKGDYICFKLGMAF